MSEDQSGIALHFWVDESMKGYQVLHLQTYDLEYGRPTAAFIGANSEMRSFCIRAQQGGLEHAQLGKVYAMRAGYLDAEITTTERATKIARVLKTLERKLGILAQRFGYPADFGDYVARVADALKVRTILVRKSPHGPYCELDGYMVFNVVEGVQYIRQQIARWASAQKEKE